MFKKLLIVIPVLAIIIAASVQGTQARYAVGEQGQRVVLATDAGVVYDKSFNQDSFLGVTNFLQEYYKLDGRTNNYVDGAEESKIGILNNYKTAVFKKADALVMPGFAHQDPISDPAASFLDDKTIVILDAFVAKPNVISVVFKAELAGLQAGFDASVWATRKNSAGHFLGDANNDGHIKMGVFGGASGKYAVDNFMFGFLLGMELYNLTIGSETGNIKVEYANSTGRTDTIEGVAPNNASDGAFFTGSFALGDALKRGLVALLVDSKNADIIFPVAGPQINDVISYRAKRGNYQPFIVGVDADQTLAHPDAADDGRFVNSAIKNLHAAVFQSLAHAKNLRQKTVFNEDGTSQLGEYNTDTWDGQAAPDYRNWSESSIGGKNQVQQHALKLYEDGQGDGIITAGQGNDDILLELIKIYHDDKLVGPEQYLKGTFIKSIAEQFKDKITPLIDRAAIKTMTDDAAKPSGGQS